MPRIQIIFFLIILSLSACFDADPNLNLAGKNVMTEMIIDASTTNQEYKDTVYVPIYSDIYSQHRQASKLLTATLSIRSTSLRDTTYINDINYYNTKGKMIRSFIDGTLMLPPMSSVDYVIERDDVEGGTGANFIVTWGAHKNTKPIIQAVMISTSGQHGLSFVTDGVSIKQDE